MQLVWSIDWDTFAVGFAVTTWNICISLGPFFVALYYKSEDVEIILDIEDEEM